VIFDDISFRIQSLSLDELRQIFGLLKLRKDFEAVLASIKFGLVRPKLKNSEIKKMDILIAAFLAKEIFKFSTNQLNSFNPSKREQK